MGDSLRFFGEVLGLHPVGERLRQARVALRGEADVPASRFGLSSLGQLRPRVAWPLWRGRPFLPRRVLITNLFNHTQTPIEDGWSVRQTQCLDFRGRSLTYDSHNGTDFTIPVGTRVTTAAPGRVVEVVSEFNRGGLKVYIDHGRGLMTTYAHLARPLVAVGDRVSHGDVIALSGYSGLDGFATFPFGVPHVHFNTWLNGEPVDPFPHDESPSMWAGGDLPVPVDATAGRADGCGPSAYDEVAVAEILSACRTSDVRDQLLAVRELSDRAARTIIAMNYYPTRFPVRRNPYGERFDREPRLSLPFLAEDFDGVTFVDDL